MHTKTCLGAGMLALFASAAPAIAGTLIFTDFSDTSLLTLNGNTTTVVTREGTVLRVTPAQRSP
jgi:hypothetical protein